MSGLRWSLGRSPSAAPIVARLNALRTLTTQEKAAFTELEGRARSVSAGQLIFEERAPIRSAGYVLSGWACRQRILADGRRQIIDIILPGDGIGVCRRPRPQAISTTMSLTPLVVADATALLRESDPVADSLNDVLDLAAARDEERLINHVVRLGRQTALERTANLLLELADRLNEVGLGDREEFPMSLTQETLADVLGLSVVHVNRTLQHLRADGLVAIERGRARLLDEQGLLLIADYVRASGG